MPKYAEFESGMLDFLEWLKHQDLSDAESMAFIVRAQELLKGSRAAKAAVRLAMLDIKETIPADTCVTVETALVVLGATGFKIPPNLLLFVKNPTPKQKDKMLAQAADLLAFCH